MIQNYIENANFLKIPALALHVVADLRQAQDGHSFYCLMEFETVVIFNELKRYLETISTKLSA